MGRRIEFQGNRLKWGVLKAIALVASLYGFYKIVTDYLDSPDLVLGATALIVGIFVVLYPFRIVEDKKS
ncbi:MAG: hypothetical protein ACRECH_03840 [Nitrososphaerales archaeon]